MSMEELYGELLDKSETAIYVKDMDTHEVYYVNRKAKEIFQIDADIIGRKCYQVLHHNPESCENCPMMGECPPEEWKQEIYYHKRYYAVEGKKIDWCENAHVRSIIRILLRKRRYRHRSGNPRKKSESDIRTS